MPSMLRAMFNRRVATLFGFLVVALALPIAGCGGTAPPPAEPTDTNQSAAPPSAEPGNQPPADSSAQPPTEEPKAAPAAAEPDGPIGDPKVTVVSPGKDPKALLRYTPKAKQSVKMTMVMAMGLAMK